MELLENDILENDDGELIVWELFEQYSTRFLIEEIMTIADSYERAMLWAQEAQHEEIK